jgi:hypothetical protein
MNEHDKMLLIGAAIGFLTGFGVAACLTNIFRR